MLFSAACAVIAAPAAEAGDERTVWVYRDAGAAENTGHWTNVVPAGIGERLRIDTAAPSGVGVGGTAVRLDVDLSAGGWCGVVVASASDYWGDRPGPALDLAFADALVFRARGGSGGERLRVKAAVAGDQPHGDSAPLPIDSGWIELSSDWQEVRIPTEGRDLRRVVTPFMVLFNDKHNPGGRLSVSLDDIRWVGPATEGGR